ncbi:MarR family transcriptional regulator [Leptospira kmetyi]|uniref:MarR family transcriptional regulator n=1 Tax=Leptospira kmetyi TaxID=408139 RepID=A0AAD0XSE8_9LEPT|nr:MarR family transcriptional regulator [Leptospira kmetyi]AYV57758.1 MarR family transcriptional regulator [Leptospira kmetyi]
MKEKEASAAEVLTQALLEFRKQGGRRHHAPDELGRAEAHVLMILSGLKEKELGLRISDLAKELEISLSTLTQTTSSLFRLGYVVRESDPTDRRVIRIRLTPIGRSKMLGYQKEFNDYCAGISEYLGEKDSILFARLLRKVSGFMAAEPKQTRMDLNPKKNQKKKS